MLIPVHLEWTKQWYQYLKRPLCYWTMKQRILFCLSLLSFFMEQLLKQALEKGTIYKTKGLYTQVLDPKSPLHEYLVTDEYLNKHFPPDSDSSVMPTLNQLVLERVVPEQKLLHI